MSWLALPIHGSISSQSPESARPAKKKLDKSNILCYSGSMRYKYKKGDVLQFTDSIFYIRKIDYRNHNYEVFVLEGFSVGSRAEITVEDNAQTAFNKFFVEKHCTQVKGAKADTIRILYGESEHSR